MIYSDANVSFTVLEVDSQLYLALNGTDSTSCGHNISTACRTFPWLLDVFYNESYVNNVQLPRLNLITATSFKIGPEILVRCQVKNLSVYILEILEITITQNSLSRVITKKTQEKKVISNTIRSGFM